MADTERSKNRFIRRFKERFFLRFHMSLILIATALTGLLVSKLLLLLHLENIVVRFPLTVVISYLAFIGLIKIWLLYITGSQPSESSGASGDILPDTANITIGSSSAPQQPEFAGGMGGTHGGGGVTGSFDSPVPSVQAGITDTSSSGACSGGEIAGAVGDVASGLDEDAIALIALGILLAVIFGSSLYLLYAAPNILAEAAFNFLLASGLKRSFKKMDSAEWIGSIFRATWIPFMFVLVITIIAAWVIHEIYPDVTKLSQLISMF
jgi:hypothetical protein